MREQHFFIWVLPCAGKPQDEAQSEFIAMVKDLKSKHNVWKC